MATNRIASLYLLDVGRSAQGSNFFETSKECILKIILNKIFAEDNDEFGMVLFGDNETNNKLRENPQYENINVIRELCLPGLHFFKQVQNLSPTKCRNSNWLQGLIVGIDLLKNTHGKRFKTKQVVIFSNFMCDTDYSQQILNTITNCIKNEKIKVIVMGLDIAEEVASKPYLENISYVFKNASDFCVSLSFPELMDSTKYFEKKRRMKRVTNTFLEIGSKIKIPVGWLKLTSEPQRIAHWTTLIKETSDRGTFLPNTIVKTKTNGNEELDTDMLEEEKIDVAKVIHYGSTKIPLSYGDLEALKRKTGFPVFSVLMFTDKSNVNPTMYVGTDVYCVLPKLDNTASQAMLSALVDAMIKAKKVAICKRIVTKNGKVTIGTLIPFSDDVGKHLFFLKLPTAEWEQPFPRYRQFKEPKTEDKQLFNDLIDSMMLEEDIIEEGKGVLVRNPNFQLRCHLLKEKMINPESDSPIAPSPQYIDKILNPSSHLKQGADSFLQKIITRFPQLSTEELQVKDGVKNDKQKSLKSPDVFEDNKNFEENKNIFVNEKGASISRSKDEEPKLVDNFKNDLLDSELNADSFPDSEDIRLKFENS